MQDSEAAELSPEPKISNQKSSLNGLPVKAPLDYLKDLVECTKADCCDGHLELCQGCGDKEAPHDGNCCKSEDSALSSNCGNPGQKNGDASSNALPTSNSLCQNFPENTLRVTGNSGGWCWVMGIQGQLSGSNSPMASALNTLKGTL